MRRLVVPFLSLVVLVSAAVALLTYLTDEDRNAALVLSEFRGDVLLGPTGEELAPAARGTRVDAATELRTGHGGEAVLTFGEGGEIRVGSSTSVQVTSVSADGVGLELEGGALEAVVRQGAGALRVGVGDRELVTLDAAFRVGRDEDDYVTMSVDRGEVQVSGVPGLDAVPGGSRAYLTPDGSGQLAPIAPDLLLQVDWPEARRQRSDEMVLPGLTVPGATVRVDGGMRAVEVRADERGVFEATIPLQEGPNRLRVEAVDQRGQASESEADVERDTKGPTFRGGVE